MIVVTKRRIAKRRGDGLRFGTHSSVNPILAGNGRLVDLAKYQSVLTLA